MMEKAKEALDCHHGRDPFVDEEYCVFSSGAAFERHVNDGCAPGMPRSVVSKVRTPDVACADAFPVTCDASAQFRTITGICNHPSEHLWGAAGGKLRRFVGSAYSDGRAEPRGGSASASTQNQSPETHLWRCRGVPSSLLPYPRTVANAILGRREGRLQGQLSAFFVYFAMLVQKDISLTPEAAGPGDCCQDEGLSCFPIQAPQGDPEFPPGWEEESVYGKASMDSPGIFDVKASQRGSWPMNRKGDETAANSSAAALNTARDKTLAGKGNCFDFKRSISFCGEESGIREQVNAQTAFVDLSFVYGGDFRAARAVRLNHMGLLKTSKWGRNLPLKGGASVGGDVRASLAPGLQAVATLFVREHNRLAGEMADLADDGKIYQMARLIAAAEFQNVVFSEYLPLLLGRAEWIKMGLDPNVSSTYDLRANPTLRNAVAAAAGRFGHAMLPEKVMTRTYRGHEKHYYLADVMLDEALPRTNGGRGVDYLLNGMMTENVAADDPSRGATFQNGTGVWTVADLLARDVQRGRDHGLPSYNSYRYRWLSLLNDAINYTN